MKKILFGAPLALIGFVLMYYIYCELNKAYWDSKVRELCEKDGGVTVYETVTLTREDYKKYGGINGIIPVPGVSSSMSEKYNYFSRVDEKYINFKNPQVRRSEYKIFKRVGDKKLGKWITYSRSGGDFPTIISHPSGFGCEDISGFQTNLEQKIFLIQGE